LLIRVFTISFLGHRLIAFRKELSLKEAPLHRLTGISPAKAFGVAILGQTPIVAHHLQFMVINFVLLWFVNLNRYSVETICEHKASSLSTEAISR
jgi:hypothetical protein